LGTRSVRSAGKRGRGRRGRGSRKVVAAPRVRFGRRSFSLFGLGCASIAAGYALLGRGSITAAPVLLVAGYCVFFPMGILLSERLKGRDGGE